jgi:hypothetical protein
MSYFKEQTVLFMFLRKKKYIGGGLLIFAVVLFGSIPLSRHLHRQALPATLGEAKLRER